MDSPHTEQFDVAGQMIRRNGLFVHQIGGEVFLVVVGKDGRDNGILIPSRSWAFRTPKKVGAR
jgi:hypothetical protein